MLAWLAATLGGTWALLAEANAPGDPGAAPAAWPESSRLPRPASRPELLFFVHPHCPCSRASLGELAVLLAESAGRLDARAVFVAPADTDADWTATDLWQAAQAIPGLEMTRDAGGGEARAFRTATSGDTLLYGADGRLIFHGGITLARGHAGDNPGRSALEALLEGVPARGVATPVFGCGLFGKTQRETPWTP